MGSSVNIYFYNDIFRRVKIYEWTELYTIKHLRVWLSKEAQERNIWVAFTPVYIKFLSKNLEVCFTQNYLDSLFTSLHAYAFHAFLGSHARNAVIYPEIWESQSFNHPGNKAKNHLKTFYCVSFTTKL